MRTKDLELWLIDAIARRSSIETSEIDPTEPFDSYGLDSASLTEIAGELEELLEKRIDATLLFDYPSIKRLSEALGVKRSERSSEIEKQIADKETRDSIAIIGMACRFPGASGPDAFWELLKSGRDAISTIPPSRWPEEGFFDSDPTVPGRSISRWGGFLDEIDGFDNQFFGISPAEALTIDPQQRLLMELAWESLEDAQQMPDQLRGSPTGVFVGIAANEYSKFVLSDISRIDGYAGTGNALSIAANRISYFFDFRGPSLSVDTACSSSLVAVILACESLRTKQSKLALAGGVNLILRPEPFIAFSKAGMMAPDGRCKAFDSRANGYVRGEGGGVIVLKRLADAIRDGDHIYASIRGWAINQDGRSNGLTAPNSKSQEQVLRAAYGMASILPRDVQYLETHGTGTLLGDSIEANALGAVVGSHRSVNTPCLIGSVKTNIGHLEAAAGIAGILKTSLALEHGIVPPSLHFVECNPQIRLSELGLSIPTSVIGWPGSNESKRFAGVSAFGFGGTNAHLVLEGALPAATDRNQVSVEKRRRDGTILLPLSARNEEALTRLASQYSELLASGGSDDPCEFCYGAARRGHHRSRLACLANSRHELQQQLRAYVAGKSVRGLLTGDVRKTRELGFVFSGQGSQWLGMGQELIDRYPDFAAELAKCDEIFRGISGRSLSIDSGGKLSASSLDQTDIAQPAIFAIQVALAALWRSWGVIPRCVIGHSMGEIAAAHVAGILSLEDAIQVVFHRARLLQRCEGKGGMLAVELPQRSAESLIANRPEQVEIAAINGPTSVTLSGSKEALEQIYQKLEVEGVQQRWLQLNYAFHSSQMDSVTNELANSIQSIRPRTENIPIFSTVTGRPIAGEEMGPTYWTQNMREPVRFFDAFNSMTSTGCDLALELGGHSSLRHPIMSIQEQSSARVTYVSSLTKELNAVRTMFSAAATLYVEGLDLDWSQIYGASNTARLLPHYPWQRKRFWLPDVKHTAVEKERADHPLLGRHVKIAGSETEHLWQNSLDLRATSYLADHRVGGQVVLPTSAYVEIVLAAGHELALSTHQAVADLNVLRPLMLVEGAPVDTQVKVSLLDPARAKVQIYAKQIPEVDWTLHAEAVLQKEPTTQNQTSESNSLRDAMDRCSNQLETSDLYRMLWDSGLQYGSMFRLAKDVRRGNSEAIGTVDLPPSLREDFGRYQFHPALFDACLHLLAACLPPTDVAREEQFAIVAGFGKYIGHRPAPESLRSHVTLKTDDLKKKANHLEGNVQMFDPVGNLVAEVQRLKVVRLVRPTSTRQSEPGFESQPWLYGVDWIERPQPEIRQSPGNMHWLIFVDAGNVGEALATQLEALGNECTRVQRGSFYDDGGSVCTIDPANENDIRQLIASKAQRTNKPYGGIVHCWSLDTPDPMFAWDHNADEAQLLGAISVLELTQALAHAPLVGSPQLWIVTRGVQAIGNEGQPVNPLQAPLLGIAKGIAFEMPELKCSRIDLDPTDGSQDTSLLLAQLFSNQEEDQVGFRKGRRYVPRLVAYPYDTKRAKKVEFNQDATYLVTGGLGGLGLAVSRWLVSRGARHLVLVSRNPPSETAKVTCEELRRQGAQVLVESGDVSDRDRILSLLRLVENNLPPLRGVIHAAGTRDDCALFDLDRGRLREVMAPKVQGSWNIHELTDSLDFFVMFSSASSVLGSPGQTNYVAANAYMDALAHRRRYERKQGLAINWGPWADIGMTSDDSVRRRFQETGIRTLSQADALGVLDYLLASDATQVVVLPFDLADLLHLYPASAGMLFFEQVRRSDTINLRSLGSQNRLLARPELDHDCIAPRSDTEKAIAGIWQRALGIEQVGVSDLFFELGGDSVFAGQIVSEVNKFFGVRIDLEGAFERFTVEHLAGMVEDQVFEQIEQLSEDETKMRLRNAPSGTPQ